MAVLGIKPNEGDSYFVIYLKYLWIFVFVFFLFTINLLAVSISFQCNKKAKSLAYRIGSAIFAFFFGIVYIALNYYSFKVGVLEQYCDFNTDVQPFKFN